MAKINNYPPVDSFTSEEKAEFLSGANFVASGCKTSGGPKVAANVPLNELGPSKLSDLTDDITQNTYDNTSTAPISGQGVAAALSNVGGRVYAEFTDGIYSTYARRFELNSTTEVLTGLNSANIAVNTSWSTFDGFVVPVAGLYRVTLALNVQSSQAAATISPFIYGLLSKAEADATSGSGIVASAKFMLDNVNEEKKTVHMHATLMIEANDIIAPFFTDNPLPSPFEQTNEPASVSLASISFDKLGPYVPSQNNGN
jgi:hypothetical protein